jgi:hypothetical protein
MRALAAALAAILWSTALAQPADQPGPPQAEVVAAPPAPPARRLSFTLAGGYEAARLQFVPFSGPAVSAGLQFSRVAEGALGLRLKLLVQGRRGETPEGLAGTDFRLGAMAGCEYGRFGLGAGLDWMRVGVERNGPGTMVGWDLALRLAAMADLFMLDRGAVFLEVSGTASGDTRQRTGALLLGARFDLN